MSHNNKFTLIAAASLMLAACSSVPPAPSAAPVAPISVVRVPARAAPVAPMTASVLLPHLDPNSKISTERSVYFDFDNYMIKPEFAATIQMHASYLAAHPTLAVKIEGNADERGGSEYNLALGQKRAEATARALKALGVRDTQLEAVSFGEVRPLATGHDEASWAKNRRADIAYPER